MSDLVWLYLAAGCYNAGAYVEREGYCSSSVAVCFCAALSVLLWPLIWAVHIAGTLRR